MHEEEQIDPVLAVLVDVANTNGSTEGSPVQIHLTVVVGGATVTGIVTGHAEWFEAQEMVSEYAEDIRKDQAEEKTALGALEELKDIGPQWRRAVNDVRPVGYLHLRKARFFAGPNLVPSKEGSSDGMYWRCKLKDVSGWAFGSLVEGAPQLESDLAA